MSYIKYDKFGTRVNYDDNGIYRSDIPAIEYSDGTKYWVNSRGIVHRVNGPSITYGEFQEYYIDGILHRLDGPAIIYSNGSNEWWFYGERLSREKEKLLNIWYEKRKGPK